MINYINALKETVEEKIEDRKLQLNNLCECCNEKQIEIVYKPENFTEEYIENGNICYRLNAHFFCLPCYRYIIKTEQLDKSSFMNEIDEKYHIV